MKAKTPVVFALLLIVCSSLSALDIGIEGKISNIGFPWTQVTPTPNTVVQFPVDQLFGGAKAYLSDTIGENLKIYAEYDMDPVLRNSLSATIEYRMSFLTIAAGPTFGIFNSPTSFLKSGLASRVELEWPGVGVFKASTNSSLGGGIRIVGDYMQESSEFMLGVYIANTICSANMISKKFEYQASATTMTSDVLTEYSFKADIFKKNVPYNILMTIGYRNLAKYFVIYDAGTGTDIQTNDMLGTVIIGTKVTVSPMRQLKIIADLEGAVYTMGIENLAGHGPSMDSFIFKAGLGVSWSFDKSDVIPEAEPDVPAEETPKLEPITKLSPKPSAQ